MALGLGQHNLRFLQFLRLLRLKSGYPQILRQLGQLIRPIQRNAFRTASMIQQPFFKDGK